MKGIISGNFLRLGQLHPTGCHSCLEAESRGLSHRGDQAAAKSSRLHIFSTGVAESLNLDPALKPLVLKGSCVYLNFRGSFRGTPGLVESGSCGRALLCVHVSCAYGVALGPGQSRGTYVTAEASGAGAQPQRIVLPSPTAHFPAPCFPHHPLFVVAKKKKKKEKEKSQEPASWFHRRARTSNHTPGPRRGASPCTLLRLSPEHISRPLLSASSTLMSSAPGRL